MKLHQHIRLLLIYFSLGNLFSLALIGFIHCYSYFFEDYFCYAEWKVIVTTTLLSGIPFGLSIWAFTAFKKINKKQQVIN